jgi:hypothetical protein
MGGRNTVDGGGETIHGVLQEIAKAHPALGLHLFDETGRPRRNIICLHRGQLVRASDFSKKAVQPGDELTLTNALAGG